MPAALVALLMENYVRAKLYRHHPLSVEDLMALVRMFGAQVLPPLDVQDFTELLP